MAIAISSPFTGASIYWLTGPTYSFVDDTTPDGLGEQIAITALGGTQTGVTTHSVSSPFTCSAFRPKSFKTLPQVNPVTGTLPSVPRNVYKIITRKGVVPLAGQAPVPMLIETIIHVPAGADTEDAENIGAALSAHIGYLWDQSDGIGTLTTTGVL